MGSSVPISSSFGGVQPEPIWTQAVLGALRLVRLTLSAGAYSSFQEARVPVPDERVPVTGMM